MKQLEDLFNKARIDSYYQIGDTASIVLDKYHTNIKLSEAMFPILSYLEVILRNRIDKVLKTYYGEKWLLHPFNQSLISIQDQNKIKETVLRIKKEKHLEASHDDIIAQMTFGFWCSFFHKKYDPIVWHKKSALKMLLPNISRINRKRKYIELQLLKIKGVRNRIAHHESILSQRINIKEIYQMTTELLAAISIDAYQMLKTTDRFPQTYEASSHLITNINSK